LEIEVKTLKYGSLLSTQSKYLRDILHQSNIFEAKSIFSSMVSNCKLSKEGFDFLPDATSYRSIDDALQYATITCPEISYALIK